MTRPLTPEEMQAYIASLKKSGKPPVPEKSTAETSQSGNALTVRELEAFLARPGINLKGICREAGVTQQPLYRYLNAGRLPGKKMLAKLLPVMRRYGFKS